MTFRILGVIVIAFAVASITLVPTDGILLAHGVKGPSGVVLWAALLITLGVGLLLNFKWAVILFSGACLVIGVGVVIGSIATVPMPWTIIDIGIGALFFAPGALVFRNWRKLGRPNN